MLNIVPSRNLLQNTGFGDNGTHTKTKGHAISLIKRSSFNFPIIENKNIQYDIEYEIEYIKKVWQSYKKRTDITQFRLIISEIYQLLSYSIKNA